MTRDRLKYFRIEARELLDQLGQGALDLEKGVPPADLIARLLRVAHTLKGAARVVKQAEIADLAHRVEDIVAVVRDTPRMMTGEEIDLLLKTIDGISTRVAALSAPSAPAEGTSVVPTVSEELYRALRPDIDEMDGLLDTLAEARGHVSSLAALVGQVEQLRHRADLVLDHLGSPVGGEMRSDDRSAGHAVRALAEELQSKCGTLEHDLAYRVTQVERELREARTSAERLRLVPASAVFTLLERTARDTAQVLEKRVSFEGRGGDVRLDAQVLAVLQSALVQLVRNAVAHGIERPAARAARGKSAEGRVTIEVSRRGPHVAFTCADDGNGVDVEAIRQLVAQKGLDGGESANLAVDALFRRLLRGGLSTSGTVTNVSGRGVGLDVVREAAEKLGGDVSLQTTPGTGTSISVVVPLTLAAFQGLVVEAGGVAAVLPLDAVSGSMRLPAHAAVRTAAGRSIVHDGEQIPLGDLALAVAPHASVRESKESSVVVVKGRSGRAAFAVGRVLETTTAIVRRLPDLASAAPFVAGVALDESGAPRLVLDPDALVTAAERTLATREEVARGRAPVLVIDDSLTTRMLEQSILESAGYAVELATSGEEALEKARSTRYALFLVDVEMPGMDGFTFIERARMDPDLKDIPAILVTSRNAPEDVTRGKAVGARAYIVKSEFDQGVLLERIRGLVS